MARPHFAFALLLALSACAGTDQATRNTLPEAASGAAVEAHVVAPRYTVVAFDIRIPRTLVVSEANLFYPIADIVWRGDPPGDRYDQIGAIFAEAMEAGRLKMHAGTRVLVTVELTRFHALTQKTRYTIGGVHSIHYLLTVRDARTGAVIDGPRPVRADVKASGGARAIAEDQGGRTQRVVIVEALTASILRELSQDEGLAPTGSAPQDPS